MEMKHPRYNPYLKKTFLKMSQKLSSNKACISNDTAKIIRNFAIAIIKSLKIFSTNACNKISFQIQWKKLKSTQFLKHLITPRKTIIVQSVPYRVLQRSLKVPFSYNKIAIWITSSQNILWSKHSQNTLTNDIKVGATIIGVNTGNHR